MVLAPGDRLGRYEIQAVLGTGGMGEVYRARDPHLGRDVAIKVLPALVPADPDRLQRFEQEARAAAALNHPNILSVYDVGTEGGLRYIVSELLDGQTLREQLNEGPLTVRKAVEYAVQIAHGLEAAHEKGIAHRDLKPENLLIAANGRVKILDFGLAKFSETPLPADLGGASTHTSITLPGTILGTLGYMSPEQIRGLPADHRSDLFAFGAILYEMLSGRRAFRGDTAADTMMAILKEPAPPLPADRNVPAALERIVDRCLEKAPAARFQSAGDLAFALEGLSSYSEAGAALTVGRSRPPRASIAWAVAVLAVMVAVALGMLTTGRLTITSGVPIYRSSILPPEHVTFSTATPAGGLALSPDGRRLVYTAQGEDGRVMLWVRSLDGLTAQPLAGTEGAYYPFWSPDSESIAFFAGGTLRKIDVAGGSPVTLCETPRPSVLAAGGTWNRDGVILFAQATMPIYRVPASGGTPVQATTLDEQAGETQHWAPFFLPDDRHFLYFAAGSTEGGPDDPNGVYVGALDGPDRTRLFPGGSNAKYANGYLVFPRERMLAAQAFDPNRLTLSGDVVPIADQVAVGGLSGRTGAFSVSDTGVLAYQSESGEVLSQLTWFDWSGAQVGTVGAPADYGDLELSPDGTEAAVSVFDPARRTRDLYLVDVARGVRTRFTVDPADEQSAILVARRPAPRVQRAPARLLRSLSARRERAHRSPGAAGRYAEQGPDELVARRECHPVFHRRVRRRQHRSLAAAPGRRRVGGAVSAHAVLRNVRPLFAGRPMGRVRVERDRAERGVRDPLPGAARQVADLDGRRQLSAVATRRARALLHGQRSADGRRGEGRRRRVRGGRGPHALSTACRRGAPVPVRRFRGRPAVSREPDRGSALPAPDHPGRQLDGRAGHAVTDAPAISTPGLSVTDRTGRRVVRIDKSPFAIGRSDDSDLRVVGSEVSRQHAEIVADGDRYVLRDSGSRYGTFVNGEPQREHTLVDGDRIRLGRSAVVDIVFLDQPEEPVAGGSLVGVVRQMAALLEGLRGLGAAHLLQDVLVLVLDAAIEVAGAERGFIMLATADGRLELTVGRARGRVTLPDETFGASRKIPNDVFATGEARLVRDLVGDDTAAEHSATVALGIRQVLCVPLRLRQYVNEAGDPPAPIGVLYLDGREGGGLLSPTTRLGVEALATEAAVAIENARLYRESVEKARLDRELRIAAEMQRALRPASSHRARDFEIAGASQASRAIGGDFFDYLELPDGAFGLALGDVAGKGPPAAVLAGALQGMFAAYASSGVEPGEMLSRVNVTLERHFVANRFATMAYGVLRPGGRFAYSLAGHNPPLLVRGRSVRRLDTGGMPLALFLDATFPQETVPLEAGDVILLFSDGVSEASDPSGDPFGDERIEAVVRANPGAGAETLLAGLLAAVHAFTQGAVPDDDVTALVLRYLG